MQVRVVDVGVFFVVTVVVVVVAVVVPVVAVVDASTCLQ